MTDFTRTQSREFLTEADEGPSEGTVVPRLAPVGRDHLPMDGATVFELEKLSIFYGTFRAVRDVTLNMHTGQITALIGPSGCG